MTSEGLLDTSVLVGWEKGRVDPARLPERAAISTMTLAELHLGVLIAAEAEERAHRLATLTLVERAYEPIPVSADVARRFAELVASLQAAGRRVPVIDTLIAATALVHGLVVYTQDAVFETFPALEVVVIA
jgi:predicted nucleic acid-binding protein